MTAGKSTMPRIVRRMPATVMRSTRPRRIRIVRGGTAERDAGRILIHRQKIP